MTTSTGASLRSPSSRATSPTSPNPTSLWADLGVFLVVGGAAAVIDLYVRAPLHMPGWRGLFTMGFFIVARQFSARAWAASAAAGVTALTSVALTSVALAGPPQFSTLAFLVPGLMIDLVYGLGSRFRDNAAFAGFAAGLGNLAKLAVTFLFAAAATRRNETAGLILPWVSHFAFGLVGGVVAALAVRWSEPKA